MNADSPYHEDDTGSGAEEEDRSRSTLSAGEIGLQDSDDGEFDMPLVAALSSPDSFAPVGSSSTTSMQQADDSDEEMFDLPVVAEAASSPSMPAGPSANTGNIVGSDDDSDDQPFDLPVVTEAVSSPSVAASPLARTANMGLIDDSKRYDMPITTPSGEISESLVQTDDDSDEEMFDLPLVAEPAGKVSDNSDDENTEWLFGPPPITADLRANTDDSDDGQFDMPIVSDAASSSGIEARLLPEQINAADSDDDEHFDMPVVSAGTPPSGVLDTADNSSDDEQFDMPVIADLSSSPYAASGQNPLATSLVDDDGENDEHFDFPVIAPGSPLQPFSPPSHKKSAAVSADMSAAAGSAAVSADMSAAGSAAAGSADVSADMSAAGSADVSAAVSAAAQSLAGVPAAKSSAVDSPGVALLRGLGDRDAAQKIAVSTVELLDEIITSLHVTKQNRVGNRSKNGRNAISRSAECLTRAERREIWLGVVRRTVKSCEKDAAGNMGRNRPPNGEQRRGIWGGTVRLMRRGIWGGTVRLMVKRGEKYAARKMGRNRSPTGKQRPEKWVGSVRRTVNSGEEYGEEVSA
ncbi:hypothetical protein BXZ70DRAFT_911135 [Cristinia sonorae]|uniref:Uncharacterized protein n=1 Tax=Cristinia sonorae TaxID=1940300 RepID=A0A8K0XKI8_9AGAR|nr:hypothetical protein BXZ70DRAFT_911135 [Cristinia sonorae]